MAAEKFTRDQVKILLSYIGFFYDQCIVSGEKFEDKNKYMIIKEILNVIERNDQSNNNNKNKTNHLKLIK